ncbi:MAG: hypothetical protein QG633_139 [Patescibacteria group bacterium]|nr:hypothetical protein [Patescibacteria group bacterium]
MDEVVEVLEEVRMIHVIRVHPSAQPVDVEVESYLHTRIEALDVALDDRQTLQDVEEAKPLLASLTARPVPVVDQAVHLLELKALEDVLDDECSDHARWGILPEIRRAAVDEDRVNSIRDPLVAQDSPMSVEAFDHPVGVTAPQENSLADELLVEVPQDRDFRTLAVLDEGSFLLGDDGLTHAVTSVAMRFRSALQ